jgi:hypothetical protein
LLGADYRISGLLGTAAHVQASVKSTFSSRSRSRNVTRIDADQMAYLTREHFFTRVASFILEQSPQADFRALASDRSRRNALWLDEWSWLATEPAQMAAMFMCFVLACAALGLDPQRGVALARGASDPAFSIKTFLSERGLMRFSAFDTPELTRLGAG